MQNAVDEGKKAGDKIKNSSQEAARSLQDSYISSVEKVAAKISNFGSSVLKVFSTIAKAGVAAAGVAAAGVTAIVKASVDQYSDYEQLVGGVETLFKDSSGKVINYANIAYQSAGLSANRYMDTVTSFSASLLQGLSGDTEAAADIANQAIVDMADNANKMGTDISRIQDAYQGFAKQNYTMLDNLKLGYGGTATEMARLINDSGVLGDTMLVTAENVNEVSFDKMIEAIHVIQDNLGITGTTALEAASTIQGSVSSMKAAWQNLLTGVADDTQDFGQLVDVFVDSVGTAANNIAPRIEIALEGVGKLIEKLAPIIAEKLPEIASNVLPSMISAAETLFNSVVSVAKDYLPPRLGDALQTVIDFLRNNVIPSVSDFIKSIDVDEISSKIERIFGVLKAILPVVSGIIGAVTGFYGIFKAMKLADKISSIIGTISKAGGIISALGGPIGIIVAAIAAVIAVVATLYATNEDFRNAVNSFLSDVADKVKAVWEFIQPYIQTALDFIKQTFQNIIDSLKPVIENIIAAFQNAWELIKMVWDTVSPFFIGVFGAVWATVQTVAKEIGDALTLAWTVIKAVWDVVTGYFSAVWNTIAGIFAVVKDVLSGDFSGAWEAIKGILSGWGEYFSGLWDDVKSVFSGVVEFFSSVGQDVVDGIKEGIDSAWEGLKSFVKNLWEGVKGIFHIGKGDVTVEGGTVSGSHAGGLDYVPYNDYVANLHRGEMVLTAPEADAYRKNERRSSGGVTVVQNIYSKAQTAADLMREAKWEQERAVMMGV